jgi:hypothetical protein
MPHSEFATPVQLTAGGIRLVGRLEHFADGTPVRLQVTVMQSGTRALAEVDEIVTAPAFEVSATPVEGSPKFEGYPVVVTAHAAIAWGQCLDLQDLGNP